MSHNLDLGPIDLYQTPTKVTEHCLSFKTQLEIADAYFEYLNKWLDEDDEQLAEHKTLVLKGVADGHKFGWC